mmetsp:Transcript_20629/g.62137  ORF Transcript_20629/g.62137 Transcript_20629/m.62137 type:complete len:217 (-) Transcript_20629:347-997(-)
MNPSDQNRGPRTTTASTVATRSAPVSWGSHLLTRESVWSLSYTRAPAHRRSRRGAAAAAVAATAHSAASTRSTSSCAVSGVRDATNSWVPLLTSVVLSPADAGASASPRATPPGSSESLAAAAAAAAAVRFLVCFPSGGTPAVDSDTLARGAVVAAFSAAVVSSSPFAAPAAAKASHTQRTALAKCHPVWGDSTKGATASPYTSARPDAAASSPGT